MISNNGTDVNDDLFKLVQGINDGEICDLPPKCSTDEIEPLFNAETDVKFYLYTNGDMNRGQELKYNDVAQIIKANFKINLHTRFLIHGWQNHKDSDFNKLIKTALLKKIIVNVIVVDWSVAAQSLDYCYARSQVYKVGPFVAKFINFLVSSKLLSSHKLVNIIGHSLGAHTAGIAGKHTKQKVNIIFGLDPARK